MAMIPDSHTVRFPASVMTPQTVEARALISASDAKYSTSQIGQETDWAPAVAPLR